VGFSFFTSVVFSFFSREARAIATMSVWELAHMVSIETAASLQLFVGKSAPRMK